MLALKQTMQQLGISQAALARDLNLSTALVAQLLNHEKWPTSPDKQTLKGLITEALADRSCTVTTALFESASLSLPAGDATPNQEDKDMLQRKQTLKQSAKKHFGIFKDPFDSDMNDSEDVFSESVDIRYVRDYLWSTAKNGGFVAIVGESGAGKSTLRKDLEDRISREQAPVILVQPYVIGMEDNDKKGKVLKSSAIADAIISTVAPTERPKSTSEYKFRQLHKVLIEARRAGFKVVLLIEEAHALNTQTLKQLKRFYELEDGFKKLLSIVLIGQTELKTRLSIGAAEVREVVQRCELVELRPLDDHLENYIRFKFDRAGADFNRVFAADAMGAIRSRLVFTRNDKTKRETISLMYPLMINNIITAALNLAADLGIDKLNAELIMEA